MPRRGYLFVGKYIRHSFIYAPEGVTSKGSPSRASTTRLAIEFLQTGSAAGTTHFTPLFVFLTNKKHCYIQATTHHAGSLLVKNTSNGENTNDSL